MRIEKLKAKMLTENIDSLLITEFIITDRWKTCVPNQKEM